MRHILPYDQLLEVLDMDEQMLAKLMREDDFIDVKLLINTEKNMIYERV